MNKRLILTFATTHLVLAAEKTLRTSVHATFSIRPTPTPPGLSTSICGMSIEILVHSQKEAILACLASEKLNPAGTYLID